MPSSYNTRTIPNTTYIGTRLGGSYLLDWNGEQVLDFNSQPIISITYGGDIPLTQYTTPREYRLITLGEIEGTLLDMQGILGDYYSGISP